MNHLTMKHFIALLLVLCNAAFWSAPASAAPSLQGEVLEVKNVDNYTYVRLKTSTGETWAAVPTATLKTGAKVTVENAMEMHNFESKSLKKTFPSIFFGTLAGAAGAPAAQSGAAAASPAKGEVANDVKVTKATGALARTVAEIIGKRTELKDKPVLLHAQVVKFNGGIMGKNWLHLRDGSGSAADDTQDILATSADVAKVGDIVLVKGTVRLDKDFGSGYSYKVLVEDAKLQK
jgi:hypothetical protein